MCLVHHRVLDEVDGSHGETKGKKAGLSEKRDCSLVRTNEGLQSPEVRLYACGTGSCRLYRMGKGNFREGRFYLEVSSPTV